MKQLYLHIGVPKTATKTIQVGLRLNRNWLLARDYYLPQTGSVADADTQTRGLAHHDIPRGMARHARYNPNNGNLNELVQEMRQQPHTHYIISSEIFSNVLDADHIRTLRQQLPARWQVYIIVYIRSQDELLHSWWAQLSKTMRVTDPFPQMAPKLVTSLRAANYDPMLRDWEQSFGQENIRLSVFEDVLQQGHIFHSFLQTCGLTDVTGVEIPRSTNTTPSEKTMVLTQEIARQLAPTQTNLPIDGRARLHYFNEVLLKFTQQANWNDSKINKLTPDLSEQIMAHFEAGNRAVAQRYFQRDVLFRGTPSPRPVTSHPADDYTVEELKALLYANAQAHIHQQAEVIQLRTQLGTVRKKLKLAQEELKALLYANAQAHIHQQAEVIQLRTQLGTVRKKLKLAQGQATVLEGRAALLEQHNAQLAAEAEQFKQELALRRSMPLARASELLYAAQREWQQGGPSGFAKRLTAWLRGERRHTPVE